MRLLKFSLYALSVMYLATGCDSVDFKKTKAGVPYKIFGKEKGEKIKQNNVVKFMIIQNLGDSELVNSYKTAQPQYTMVEGKPASYDLMPTIMEIFLNSKKGDSIYFVHSIDSFFARNPGMAQDSFFQKQKGKQLITTIRVVEVFKSPEVAQAEMQNERMKSYLNAPEIKSQINADQKIIEDHLAKSGIQAKKTELGTYVQIIEQGQGAEPEKGKFASIRYKGMDLQGKTFDSNMEPGKQVFPIQIGLGQSIPGFEDGIRQLKKGGKARIFIPSPLGYGSQGAPPRIAPNQILVFDVELVDVTNTAPVQPQMSPENLNSDTSHQH